ncbi:MAG: helix-turn-helix transcriptional regulator [Candidatus Dormibacteraeota bacterium]|nr:helix-turn-helix transcriptional regulator [Candidatus Dormibacteraeota bacterium]
MGLRSFAAPADQGNESPEAILARLDRHLERAELELRQLRGGYEALLKARLRISEWPADGATLDALTPRERRVAVLVAAGNSNREVAELLDVSVHTVKSQVKSILRKLELHTRWQLADGRFEG